ncbi:acyltransferase [Morganella morganii]|uniref:acyltransferase family protein n=1 Tax=Morganella morganii TaxID=582 RepID=UPI00055B318D|nr:acyltransferase [Morganella morganii]MBO8066377.1 acyltransferase [Morganella morganii]
MTKSNKEQSKNNSNRNLKIDGLRGVLAVSVFFHHTVISYYWIKNGTWEPIDNIAIMNLGSVSVSLFFMITGYLFYKIAIKNKSPSWRTIYLSRVFRIYPVYIIAVALIFLIYFIKYGGLNVFELIKLCMNWLLFQGVDIGDFEAKRVIAGVQWTLVYEFVFYISLPFLTFIYWRKFTISNIISASISAFFVMTYVLYYDVQPEKFILFLFGFLAYEFKNSKLIIPPATGDGIINFMLVVIISIIIFYTEPYSMLQSILTGFIFIFICSNNRTVMNFMNRRELLLLGEISYSIYLTHGIVIFLIYTICIEYNIHNTDESPNDFGKNH